MSDLSSVAVPKQVSVLIVDQSIDSFGIIANAAFVLGLSAGRVLPDESFGEETVDGDGSTHRYLTKIGHYVRKASQGKLKTLRDTLIKNSRVLVVDYTEDAAPADYSEYATNLRSHTGEQIKYRAIHFFGPEEIVVPVTKNLSKL